LKAPHNDNSNKNGDNSKNGSNNRKNNINVEEHSDQPESNNRVQSDIHTTGEKTKENKSNEKEICKFINCFQEKYTYFSQNSKCPEDSSPVSADNIEKECCNLRYTCVCNKCPQSSEEAFNQCKLNGKNFESLLIRKGEQVPGKCCDIYLCRK
jgi:hypothetical protein